MTKKLRALGADIFAGLFTHGILKAGYEVLGHLEHTTFGTPTARLNYPWLDIRNGTHSWKPHEYTGKVDFMYTNPPCAAWSAMQVTNKWEEHTERLQIVRDLVDAGRIIRPKAWCWESVTGAWKKGRAFVLEQAEAWLAYGYHVTVLLQNNKHLGTPQDRARMFVIAHQHPLVWPPFKEPITFQQAMKAIPAKLRGKGDLTKIPASIAALWQETGPGGSPRHVLTVKTDKEQAKLRKLGSRPAMTVHKVNPEKVARCFIGSSKFLHPHEPRYLNWYECLALVGLPMDWQSARPFGEMRSLELSRAVMPATGEWLGRAVADGLTRRKLDPTRPVCRLVDLRKPDAIHEEVLMTYSPPPVPPPVAWDPPTPPERSVRAPRVAFPRGNQALGSGERIRQLLRAGKGTAEILATIHAEYPGSKASGADVSYQRARVKKENYA